MVLRNVLACTLLMVTWICSSDAQAASERRIDIPAQGLGPALAELAKQTGVQVIYPADLVTDIDAPALAGTMTPQDALTRLLATTRLKFEFVDAQTVTLTQASAIQAETPANKTASERSAPAEPRTPAVTNRSEPQQDAQPAPSPDTRDDQAVLRSGPAKLGEIVVTAQKRSELLQEVPVPVTAINANLLVNTNQLEVQDYYTRIPGLSLTPPGSYGGSTIAIRGLVSGLYANPTVGIVVDDVPYGSPSSSGFGNIVAEIDPSDLAQVEVLRGPQGTLYGASSIGGLLKYVTIEPSMDGFSGSVQAGLTDVHNGDEAGYSFRGNVNIPFGDNWAIRASGYTREDPGFIDDPDHGLEEVNREQGDGGRLAALWRPSESFSLRLSALMQDSESSGNNYVTLLPGVGDLEQSVVPNSGGYDKRLEIYGANLTAKLGNFDLTSVTAYTDIDTTFRFDFSPGLGAVADAFFGVNGVAVVQPSRTTRFTEELRASTSLGSRTDWLLGLFYATEDTTGSQSVLAADFDTGATAGELLLFNTIASFEEYAAFTNFTFQLSDRFDLQVGGRANRNEPTYAQTVSGALIGTTVGGDEFKSRDSSFTYLLTPRFRVSPDIMLYARFASGYRPGGPNSSIGFGIPPEYGPDKTQNYEIGVKGDVLEGALSFDASAYYIDWKDIQLALFTVAGYIDNGSRARSRGVELSLNAEPTSRLSISTWLAYNDAELTEDLPPANAHGLSGDRLPYSARFSGSMSVTQEFPMTATLSAFAEASVSYVGDRKESFPVSAAATRRTLPSYTKTDLIAGLRYGTWSVNLFVNNVADERGMLGADATGPNTVTYIRPRTVGLSVSNEF